jgi:CDGSH iron-sulfur domain-containing protein 3
MSDVKIKVVDNGPLIVTGEVQLVDMDGNQFTTHEQFKLCRCGLSSQKPFCDGSHRGNFESTVRASE